MAINFSETLASIHADLNQRSIFFSVVLGALLLCWFGWLLWVPQTMTKQAKGVIEIDQPTLLLVASVAGRIDSVNLREGDLVKANEPLITINSEDEAKQISALTHSLEKQQNALVALHKTHESELQALTVDIAALEQHQKNAQAQVDTVRAQYDQQAKTVNLLSSIHSAVSKIELSREELSLKQIQERLLTKQQDFAHFQVQHKQAVARRDVLLAGFTQENANQQSRIAALEAELSLQQQLLKHKTLSAPKAAKVAEVMPLQIGQWINSGDQLATLFPEGALRVVAHFKPIDALGYLQRKRNSNATQCITFNTRSAC
jgi:multidrug resistance efflux pump